MGLQKQIYIQTTSFVLTNEKLDVLVTLRAKHPLLNGSKLPTEHNTEIHSRTLYLCNKTMLEGMA